MEKIRLTLETLYDCLRNEKKREDLQKLEESFFLDVVNYLKEKTADERSREKSELFATGEQEKLAYELRSIKRILKELYDKREKKIITIALNRSRTGSDLIDTSTMLQEENSFYLQMVELLDQYRKGVLLKLFQGRLPEISEQTKKEEVSEEKTIEEKTEQKEAENEKEKPAEKDTLLGKPEGAFLKQSAEKDNSSLTRIRFLHSTPGFIWKDMKVYGPFEKSDETEIFSEVAELLVRKGRAEKL